MKPNAIRCDLLEVPGAHNVRDIGGYPGREGKPVRKGRFLRAGGMHALTDDGVRAVRECGVDCIVDLRSVYEADSRPDTLRDDGDIAYVHIPMLDYIQSSMAGELPVFPTSMPEMYIGLLEKDKDGFLRLFQVFADPAYRTVLFHCTAGKDRTGVSAMLLLGLAGVSHPDIVEDYAHSDKLFHDRPTHPALPAYLFESLPATMEAALEHLDKTYGGIRPYLAHIGVDADMERRLLNKLLEP